MATELLLVKELNRLAAYDPISADTLATIGQKEVVRATIRRPRNVRHHRKFFALLHVVFESQSYYPTPEMLLTAIKVALGYCETIKVSGTEVTVPKSISFATMGQSDFEKFYDRVVEFVITKILPRTRAEDLEMRVLEILG